MDSLEFCYWCHSQGLPLRRSTHLVVLGCVQDMAVFEHGYCEEHTQNVLQTYMLNKLRCKDGHKIAELVWHEM